MSPLLALSDIACVRGGRMVFEALSLRLGPGEAALVTGPNGVGKSSLLRIAAGLLRPAAGQVVAVRGALLDARIALDGEQPLGRALAFWQRLGGAAPVADALLAELGLAHLVAVPVRLLSTGQRQRAALARVIAGAAPLWLLDEPANGLDASSLAVLERLVAAHRAEGGAVVIATHIPVALPGAVPVVLESPVGSGAGA